MDALIHEFRLAYAGMKGDQLAETLHPNVPLYSAKLRSLWDRGDARATRSDLNFLFYQDHSRVELTKDEASGWFEIYLAYWKAVGEILAAEGLRDGTKVRLFG
jgi:COP9 signalosome complex subunit 12